MMNIWIPYIWTAKWRNLVNAEMVMTVIWKYSGFMRTCLNQTNSTTKANNMQVSKILILFTGLRAELLEIALNSLRKDKCCFYIVYSKVDDWKLKARIVIPTDNKKNYYPWYATPCFYTDKYKLFLDQRETPSVHFCTEIRSFLQIFTSILTFEVIFSSFTIIWKRF